MSLQNILTAAWASLIALTFITVGAIFFSDLTVDNKLLLLLMILLTFLNVVVSIGTIKYKGEKYSG